MTAHTSLREIHAENARQLRATIRTLRAELKELKAEHNNLLDILQGMLDAYWEAFPAPLCHDSTLNNDPRINAARAVLAKAEGR